MLCVMSSIGWVVHHVVVVVCHPDGSIAIQVATGLGLGHIVVTGESIKVQPSPLERLPVHVYLIGKGPGKS